MIKHLGDILKSQSELKKNKHATSFVFDNASFSAGSLSSSTITIKDLISTKEGTTQGSSKILDNFISHYDATVIKKIKNAGAAIVAKVHSDELGLGGTGQWSAYGHIKNNLDPKRIVGGSSSGSVATFSSAISLALATDTGDSVRLPASYNGIFGFKPSYGAISRYGVYAFASSLDTVGIFAHNVHDVIEFSKVAFGQDPLDMTSKEIALPNQTQIKPQKVAFLKFHKSILSPEIAENFQKLISKLKNDGIQVSEVEVPEELLSAIETVYSIISFSEASSNDSNLNGISFGNKVKGNNWEEVISNTRTKWFGKMVQRRFTLGAFYLSTENQKEIFIRAQKVRRIIVDAFNKIYNNYDFLLFPASDIAPLIDEKTSENWHSSFLIADNFAGTPSIVLPWIKIQGMPAGINMSGKIYQDKKLLSHALYIEKLLGDNYD